MKGFLQGRKRGTIAGGCPCAFDELKDGAGCMSAWVCRAAGTGPAAFCLPGWHSTWEPVMFLLSLLLLPQRLLVHW